MIKLMMISSRMHPGSHVSCAHATHYPMMPYYDPPQAKQTPTLLYLKGQLANAEVPKNPKMAVKVESKKLLNIVQTFKFYLKKKKLVDKYVERSTNNK